jgi:hypothetical protein
MKRCPTCQRSYPDDKQAFCLEDGATLEYDTGAGFDAPETSPIRPARETNPPATEIMGRDYTPKPPVFHPSIKEKAPRAGAFFGVVALALAALSVVLMFAGLVGAAAKWENTLVGLLIVTTFVTALAGGAVGLVGILRAVRNNAGKILPICGFLANIIYLIFIIALLALGIAVS